MSIPYVRESATGLDVEALIKRLELACKPATDKTKRKKRNKATAEQTPDFSVLESLTTAKGLEYLIYMERIYFF